MTTYTQQADKLLITFSGRLDTARCGTLQDELMAQVNAATLPVVFDLQAVDFIASSFLRLCIMSVRKLGKECFTVAHASPSITKVFAMAGLDQLIHME